MNIRSVQRHTTIFFLIALVLVFICGLSNGIADLLSYSMDVNAMGLAIDFTNDKALGLSVLFFLQFGLSYFMLTANVFMVICGVYLIFAWLVTSILEKKMNLLVCITLVFLAWIIYCGIYNLSYRYAIVSLGLILLYERTYIANKSVYEKDSLNSMIHNYVCLFITKLKKVDGSVSFFSYLNKDTSVGYKGNIYITGLLSLLVIVGSVLSCGLLSGLLVCLKDKYVINHSSIDGKSLVYKPRILSWTFNGIRWTFLTIITLGLYWILGGLTIDYYTQRYSSTYFSDESCSNELNANESFFDGSVSEFLLIRLVGFAITIITLGFGYAYYDHIKRRYLISHCVINGLRLMDTSDLNSLFKVYVIIYPLTALTLGLFWIVYSAIYPCYFYDHVAIDNEPKLFDEDEQFVSLPVYKKEVIDLEDKKEEPIASVPAALQVTPVKANEAKKPAKRSLKRKSSSTSTTKKNTTSSKTTVKKKTTKSSNSGTAKQNTVINEVVRIDSKPNEVVETVVEIKPVEQAKVTISKPKSETKTKGSSVTVNIHSRSIKKSKGSTGRKKNKK